MIVFIVALTINSFAIDSEKISIYIDPGHGGLDKGAMVGDVLESDLNLKVALKLKEILEDKGITVYLTRDDDYDLSTDPNRRKKTDAVNRVKLINESDCTMYVSIHMNTYINSKYSGAQVFYNKINDKNVLLANMMEESFQTYLSSKRTARPLNNVYIIENVKKTGVLVECGFMTNFDELKSLLTDEYQTKIAYSIYFGIDNFLTYL